jgi:cell division septum initiation protein DivIVA
VLVDDDAEGVEMSQNPSAGQPDQPETAPIVPMEDRATGFDIVLRGYDRDQVDRHITWLEGLLGQAEDGAAAAATAADEARAEAMTARHEASTARAELERGRPSFDALGERIVTMLKLAEAEADDMRARARTDVETITQEARSLHQRTTAEREAVIGKAEREAYDIVQAARAQAQQIVDAAQRKAEALTEDAQRRLAEMSAQRDAIRGELGRLHEQLTALARGER